MVKFIVVNFSEDKLTIESCSYANREDALNVPFRDNGMGFVDGEWRPSCWRCRETSPVMVKLKDIDDDCRDEYFCTKCITEFLKYLRSLAMGMRSKANNI